MIAWIQKSVERFKEEQKRFHEFLLEVDTGERKLSLPTRGILYVVRVLYYAGKGFWFDDGFSRAAALSYSLLCSMVPLAVLLIYALLNDKLPWHLHDYAQTATKYIQDILVPSKAKVVVDYLDQLQEKLAQARDPLGLVGLGFLVIIAFSMLNMLEGVMNAVWKVKSPPLRFGRLPAFLLILCLGTAAIGLTQMVPLPPFLSRALAFLLPWMIVATIFFLLFYLVPNTRVAFFPALSTAVLSTAVWFGVKEGFDFYLAHFLTYDKIFGPLGLIPVTLLWIYLTGVVLIFGAEVTYVVQHYLAVVDRRFRIAIGSRFFPEYLTLRILVCLADKEGRPVKFRQLRKEIPLPESEIKMGILNLRRAGLVAKRVFKGFVLARPPGSIEIQPLLHLGKNALEQLKLVKDETPHGRFCLSLIASTVKGASKALDKKTLEDALEEIRRAADRGEDRPEGTPPEEGEAKQEEVLVSGAGPHGEGVEGEDPPAKEDPREEGRSPEEESPREEAPGEEEPAPSLKEPPGTEEGRDDPAA